MLSMVRKGNRILMKKALPAKPVTAPCEAAPVPLESLSAVAPAPEPAPRPVRKSLARNRAVILKSLLMKSPVASTTGSASTSAASAHEERISAKLMAIGPGTFGLSQSGGAVYVHIPKAWWPGVRGGHVTGHGTGGTLEYGGTTAIRIPGAESIRDVTRSGLTEFLRAQGVAAPPGVIMDVDTWTPVALPEKGATHVVHRGDRVESTKPTTSHPGKKQVNSFQIQSTLARYGVTGGLPEDFVLTLRGEGGKRAGFVLEPGGKLRSATEDESKLSQTKYGPMVVEMGGVSHWKLLGVAMGLKGDRWPEQNIEVSDVSLNFLKTSFDPNTEAAIQWAKRRRRNGKEGIYPAYTYTPEQRAKTAARRSEGIRKVISAVTDAPLDTIMTQLSSRVGSGRTASMDDYQRHVMMGLVACGMRSGLEEHERTTGAVGVMGITRGDCTDFNEGGRVGVRISFIGANARSMTVDVTDSRLIDALRRVSGSDPHKRIFESVKYEDMLKTCADTFGEGVRPADIEGAYRATFLTKQASILIAQHEASGVKFNRKQYRDAVLDDLVGVTGLNRKYAARSIPGHVWQSAFDALRSAEVLKSMQAQVDTGAAFQNHFLRNLKTRTIGAEDIRVPPEFDEECNLFDFAGFPDMQELDAEWPIDECDVDEEAEPAPDADGDK